MSRVYVVSRGSTEVSPSCSPLRAQTDPQMEPGPLHSSRRDDSVGMWIENGPKIAPMDPMCGYLVEIFANCPARLWLYTEAGFLLE
jgi:hypothetical protein